MSGTAANTVLTNWFTHPTYGVNAQLAWLVSQSLIRAGDTVPADFATGAIDNEIDSAAVARGDFPAKADAGYYSPALAIGRLSEVQMPGELMTQAGLRDIPGYPMLVRYSEVDADTHLAFRNWYYVERAIVRSARLLALAANDPGQDSLTSLLGVKLYSLGDIRNVGAWVNPSGIVVAGAVVLPWDLRDRNV